MSDLADGPGLAPEGEDLQLATLQRLTAQLARLSTSSDVASFALTEMVHGLGGAGGVFSFAEGDALEVSASVGFDSDVIAALGRLPIDPSTPIGDAAFRQQPLYLQSREELSRHYPQGHGQFTGNGSALAALPLRGTDGILLGVLAIEFDLPRSFPEPTRHLLEAVAREASVALERARSKEALVEAQAAAEAAISQLEFLALASSRMAASLDLSQTLSAIAELAVPRISDLCVLYLLTESNEIETHPLTPDLSVSERALTRWVHPAFEDLTGIGAVIRTGIPLYTWAVEEQLVSETIGPTEYPELLEGLDLRGALILALNVRGQRIGALAFVNRSGRAIAPRERALGEELTARAAVAIDNARLFERELRIAETLQQALLPELPEAVEGIEFGARYLPGTLGIEIGGDWYDVLRLDEHRLLFVVGDVSGRGLRAATIMASLRHAIRAYAAEGHPPSQILGNLTQLLDIERDGHFATVLCGLLHIERRVVVLASAGHLDPLLLSGTRAEFVATAAGPPVGVERFENYRAVTVPMPPGGTLLCFTDGLIERRGEPLDGGRQRLRSAGMARNATPLDELLNGVVRALTPDGSEDDTALLALRWPN